MDSMKAVHKENVRVSKTMKLRPIPLADFYHRGELTWRDFILNHYPEADADEFLRRYRPENEEIKTFPGVNSALEAVERRYKIGIVTARERRMVRKHLLDNNVDLSLIKLIIGRKEVPTQKPSPEGLILVCKKLRIRPKELVYVGDNLIDYTASKKGGAHFIGVLTGGTKRTDFIKAGAKNVIPSVKNLPKNILLR